MISLKGSRINSRTSSSNFRGFLVVSVPQNWYDALPFKPLGKLKIIQNDPYTRYASGCSETITNTDFEIKNQVDFNWTAPKAGSGCVSLKAIIFQTETVWFKDDDKLTKTLCEAETKVEKDQVPECCACNNARYRLKFKGNWNQHNFPRHWPKNEGLTHWSNLIGAVHSKNYSIWEYGGFSSDGLQELAEFGVIRTLDQEIRNQTKFGQIRNIITASGLWFPNVDKETSTQFTVSKSHHLMTFATMMGPSPDWLSGVSSLNLCLANCTWLDTYYEELYLFDAGTDSGLSYSSPNKPTIPKEPIKKITKSADLLSPFYDIEMKPFAYLTLEKIEENDVKCINLQEIDSSKNHISSAIDFDPFDFSDPLRRLKLLDSDSNIVSKKSRTSKQEKMRIIDTVKFTCLTTEWSDWTKCSSSCGNGLRRRFRHYINPDFTEIHQCTQVLEETEMCLSENGECEVNEKDRGDTVNQCLMVNKWSSWSPCSVTCGRGITIRTRSYNNVSLAESCDTTLIERKECIIKESCIHEDLMSFDEIRRICTLEMSPGPCRMTKSNIKYYFDKKKKQCLSFEYGGCRGNENNFDTFEKCETTCGLLIKGDELRNTEAVKMEKFVSNEYVANKKKICLLALDEGSCSGSHINYYFDRTKLACQPFEYSGCGGNANRFLSLKECIFNCNVVSEYSSNYEKNSVNILDLTIPEKKRICMSPAERGTCAESLERYTYNINMGKCLTFEYSGCGGNLNNFNTVQDCETVCDVLIQMAQQASEIEVKAKIEMKKKEMCLLPKEKGPCVKFIDRFYFDAVMGDCKLFKFGGCYGNLNNFESLEQCESSCHTFETKKKNISTTEPHIIPASSQIMSIYQRKNVCKQPVNEGWCSLHLNRFYFDYLTQMCIKFSYTGCGGNENNFFSQEECQEVCANLNFNYTKAIAISSYDEQYKMINTSCRITEWTEWSDCSASECGETGQSFRTRKILSESITCPQVLEEKKKCLRECKKCKFTGKWTSWSECVKTEKCENNYQVRVREQSGCQEKYLTQRRHCLLDNCF